MSQRVLVLSFLCTACSATPPLIEERQRGDELGHDEPNEADVDAAERLDTAKAKTEPIAPKDEGPRIAAVEPHVWIMPKPSHEGLALGNVRLGTSVRLRDTTPVPGNGCRAWYGVEPRGYVCLNFRTTLDLNDPYFRALSDVAPKKGELFPYSYAYSRDAPMYSRVPTPSEWEKEERRFKPAGTYAELGDWAKGHEELIENAPIEGTDPVPWFFADGKRHVRGGTRDPKRLLWKVIPNGSMVAYARAFTMHGRVWLVTSDLTLVPADRVQKIRRSKFRGVELNDKVTLPIAWNRRLEPRPLYRYVDGAWVDSGERVSGKGWRMISGDKRGTGRDPYWELRDRPGLFMKGKDTTVSWPRKELPPAIAPDEKWMEARITPGTLTAFVGLKPVYATLFSPGKGGHPVAGLDHTKYATTQTGFFRFEWKERTATMSNEKGEPKILWFSDVPHIQYIKAPLAMHVAYWHEDFSTPKSAECVNLSPSDGRWMFNWTDPPLPPDWGAIGPGRGAGKSTAIVIYGL